MKSIHISWKKKKKFQLLEKYSARCKHFFNILLGTTRHIPLERLTRILQNRLRERPKLRKLLETIWLTVITKVFKFPPMLGPFCQLDYLYELLSGYWNYIIQKWYILASFQTCRKRFPEWQEVIWLTVINKIFKFAPHSDPSSQVKCLYGLSLD